MTPAEERLQAERVAEVNAALRFGDRPYLPRLTVVRLESEWRRSEAGLMWVQQVDTHSRSLPFKVAKAGTQHAGFWVKWADIYEVVDLPSAPPFEEWQRYIPWT